IDLTQSVITCSGSIPVSGEAGFTIPAQTVQQLPGKSSALLRYTVTAVDSYMTGSVQQTGTAIVNIGLPDNVSPADCYVLPSPMDWTMQEVSNVDQTWIHLYQPPLTGDIDGDKYPEIVFISGTSTNDVVDNADSIYAFKYVPGDDELAKKWGFHHSDASNFTGLTLFRFSG
ncbi:MAG: hypothetical protein LBF85_00550, partial [Tannerella sp.]|nr:hypothetical protein [Tannerella sp.]